MNSTRDLHRVTCKCAIFNLDGTKVLLSDYGNEGYGLPGGHLDLGETPDQAMARELLEELGIDDIAFQHADFLLHPNGKIVLGYTAQYSDTKELTIQLEEIKAAVWVDVASIADGNIAVPSYGDFILNNQP